MNALGTELTAVLFAMRKPARPRLAHCRTRADAHVDAERRAAAARADALADCRARIELARASVFAADDGVVRADMTALEREWLTLARGERSSEARVLALWNAIAPRSWEGRVRFTSTGEMATDVEAAIALASDPDGVERAEACALRLASVLSAWGVDVGSAVTWRITRELAIDTCVKAMLDRPLSTLTSAIASTYGGDALLERAARIEHDALETGAQVDLALTARVDFLWRACAVEPRCAPGNDQLANPAAPLLDLWKTGYVVSALDAQGVTLGALAS